MAQIPKGRLVKGQYKPICRDCTMYCKSRSISRLKPPNRLVKGELLLAYRIVFITIQSPYLGHIFKMLFFFQAKKKQNQQLKAIWPTKTTFSFCLA